MRAQFIKKAGSPKKAPCKIHTDNSVNGYAAIYNSRNCFVSIHSRFRLTVQRYRKPSNRRNELHFLTPH